MSVASHGVRFSTNTIDVVLIISQVQWLGCVFSEPEIFHLEVYRFVVTTKWRGDLGLGRNKFYF